MTMRPRECDKRLNKFSGLGRWIEGVRVSPSVGRLKSLPGGYSGREPPDPFPNSEVKTLCADDSVAASHARVGHCQAFDLKEPLVR